MRDELCSLCDNLTACTPPQQLQGKSCLLLMVHNPCPLLVETWQEEGPPRTDCGESHGSVPIGPTCPRCDQGTLEIEGLRVLTMDITEGGMGVHREVAVSCPDCGVRNTRAYSDGEDPHLVFRPVGDPGGD